MHRDDPQVRHEEHCTYVTFDMTVPDLALGKKENIADYQGQQ